MKIKIRSLAHRDKILNKYGEKIQPYLITKEKEDFYIKISSMKQLLEIMDKIGQPFIIYKTSPKSEKELIIYDDYFE